MIFTLDAMSRDNKKKSDLTELRAQGLIPAVIYGKGLESLAVAVKKVDFMNCYKKSFLELTFYEIQYDGKKYHTLLKEKQTHPMNRDFLHLDFMVIPPKSMIEVEIPVNVIGEAAGIKEGGFLDLILRSVKIVCQADQVPDEIELDVTGLHVGEAIHVRDLPQGTWQYKDSPDNAVAVVHAKKAEAEPVETAEVSVEAPVEP